MATRRTIGRACGRSRLREESQWCLPDDAILSWRSPRMCAIENEYNLLLQRHSTKQAADPVAAMEIYAERRRACTRLLSGRLSYQDLRQLAASCDTLPPRFEDRQYGFIGATLAFMVESFVAAGDRQSLVELLSTRFVSRIGEHDDIELYLATRGDVYLDFRGNRLRDPILVLGDAYAKCTIPEVRDEIAASVRRGFGTLGIKAKDDREFVNTAMHWYMKERQHLSVNPNYYWNEAYAPLELYAISPERWASALSERPGGRQPLFEKETSGKAGGDTARGSIAHLARARGHCSGVNSSHRGSWPKARSLAVVGMSSDCPSFRYLGLRLWLRSFRKGGRVSAICTRQDFSHSGCRLPRSCE